MTVKEKEALSLIDRFLFVIDENLESGNWERTNAAKACAIIAVDLLIEEQNMWQNGQVEPVKYWQEFKKQIELLK